MSLKIMKRPWPNISATKIFQRYMKVAFEEVRTEVSNLNSFVQERVTGMKILQLFTREEVEFETSVLTSSKATFMYL